MLSIKNNPFMLSGFMLSVVMLSVIMLNVVMLRFIMLSVVMLSVILLNVVLLSALTSWLTNFNCNQFLFNKISHRILGTPKLSSR
jgi:hypothetical protein